MAIKIGNLKLNRFIKGMIGTRLIDPMEVYYVIDENVFYPIISKSGCSTIKQDLIRRYNPSFSSKFPEIHQIDPEFETNGKVLRKHFYSFKKYRNFSKNKTACLVIRNPYERVYSCFLDVEKGKNIMYQDPSGLTSFFGIHSGVTFEKFLNKVIKLPDHLSDRHFRSQSFCLQKGVKETLSNVEIVLLENYNKKDAAATKLNTNNKTIPKDILEALKNNKSFKKRFSEDLQLYNDAK
ncbi:sulfotransferase family 2 domain-containing protein [Psychroserpens ponticola]|uniref:Sulfotransferase family 2 domain-containing protein n=1 Tax=Psychroserpens ponticola TaxID=2932268 RepID=A0ABY7S0P3_9FLAO|nr:sulfotransferase family 2 domain-containing protein [Psychroserpens ponticola]WCO02981.1 sulfotransferase family 2 domain-containing protein [Psychroserpens ponticola]